MEKRSLFCDQTEMFLRPCAPKKGEKVVFRFRTGRYQAKKVLLCLKHRNIDMKWESHKNDFDYYTASVNVDDERLEYYFEIDAEGETCFYGRTGTVSDRGSIYPFVIVPDFAVPKWLQGAVMYQIYIDRFYNGDASNDIFDGEYEYYERPVKKVKDWNSIPETFDVCNFHGGDLQGIIEKLDYLEDLGIEVLYLNPAFASPSNHKYDVQDYDHVDPHLGVMINSEHRYMDHENLKASDELLAKLIEEAHKRGMKVLLDGVFNHCSHFSPWLDVEGEYLDEEGNRTGAYKNPDSKYRDYFIFEDEECIKYECWWDNINLPKLNYEGSQELFDHIMRISEKWIDKPYNADGWRLDVASDLGHSLDFNHMFWKEFRKHVKFTNPDAVIIAEHYDNAAPWLDGSQWDTVMNYRAFMDPVSWFFTGMEKHSDSFREDLLGNAQAFEAAMTGCGAEFMQQSLLCAMNQLDNHDHSRFITRTNHKVMRLTEDNYLEAEEGTDQNIYRMAVIMQMIWPGAPCLYYGDETALPGFTDPDNRRAYPWGQENPDMIAFYKKMIAFRKEYEFLRDSSHSIIHADNGILAFARFNEDEQMIAVFSMASDVMEIDLPVWMTGRAGYKEQDFMTRLVYSSSEELSFEKKVYTTRYGNMKTFIAPKTAMVFYGNS